MRTGTLFFTAAAIVASVAAQDLFERDAEYSELAAREAEVDALYGQLFEKRRGRGRGKGRGRRGRGRGRRGGRGGKRGGGGGGGGGGAGGGAEAAAGAAAGGAEAGGAPGGAAPEAAAAPEGAAPVAARDVSDEYLEYLLARRDLEDFEEELFVRSDDE